MTKLFRKSSLLFSMMLMTCASMASMASAASWFQVGTTHQLFSSNLAFIAHNSPFGTPIGFICSGWELDADVASGSQLVITSNRFSNCTGTAATANCALTPVGTGVWAATAVTTANIQIHDVNLDILYEGASCAFNGGKVLLTGTLSGGSWVTGSNETVLTNAGGLTDHFLGTGTSSPTTLNATIRDTTNTLRVFDGTTCVVE